MRSINSRALAEGHERLTDKDLMALQVDKPLSRTQQHFVLLHGEELASYLGKVSKAQQVSVTWPNIKVYSASLQPRAPNYDRVVIQELDLASGRYLLVMVIDGHGGPECADHTVKYLPDLLRPAIDQGASGGADGISQALAKAVEEFDKKLGQTLKEHIGEDASPESVKKSQVKRKALLSALRGACIVVVIVEPAKGKVWTVNVGDSLAVQATESSGEWDICTLTEDHNGYNQKEIDRIRKEHPGEEDCIMNGRVLGRTLPTRALGDFDEKFEADYVKQLYALVDKVALQPLPEGQKIRRALLKANLHPPYLTAKPDVIHRTLPAGKVILLVASDGLLEVSPKGSRQAQMKGWIRSANRASRPGEKTPVERIIRDVLGEAKQGEAERAENREEDKERLASLYLGIRHNEQWMDDLSLVYIAITP
ncbi:protein serine/threonine phosphatase 2C [Calocera viscosa TUFC12733]|uniref:Protein serine/threonine phosphatase 2C n=1 Tax=Calocera viscosa (strain TUFC12733) TaxID=1330018 RepID=A0A167G039_CALVF|nr:protein serine/threonine phosphatase 2C [Calocera viscosa TUFC12733]